jgi:excisionase family DNA binding protein
MPNNPTTAFHEKLIASSPKTMATPIPDVLAVSVPKAAHIIGVSRTTAFDLIRTGRLPVIKIGRRTLVPVAALQRLATPAASSAA